MKEYKMKTRMFSLILLAALLLGACASVAPLPTGAPMVAADEETRVRELVQAFGKRLQMVSLLAPDAAEQIRTQYSRLVSPALLETWMEDGSKAPGRMVSSPWPDRIEIVTLAAETSDRYVVEGFVIEMTSAEVTNGGVAARIPVHMVVERMQGDWLLTTYVEGR